MSEEDLLALYSHCTLFIYPSLYEGFGIPPLEAMKYNCPVIVSDIPSLREVCDNAVLYVDPYDEIDIKEGILRLLNDFNLQMELKGKGEKRSELFSWEHSAKKLRDLLNVTSNNI